MNSVVRCRIIGLSRDYSYSFIPLTEESFKISRRRGQSAETLRKSNARNEMLQSASGIAGLAGTRCWGDFSVHEQFVPTLGKHVKCEFPIGPISLISPIRPAHVKWTYGTDGTYGTDDRK
ncbi:MAG: hypothetical protein JWN70_1304 [Planctomycetaceae bacterium]|nr:hypothetical protein [Planctomycetaceae bacterium]